MLKEEFETGMDIEDWMYQKAEELTERGVLKSGDELDNFICDIGEVLDSYLDNGLQPTEEHDALAGVFGQMVGIMDRIMQGDATELRDEPEPQPEPEMKDVPSKDALEKIQQLQQVAEDTQSWREFNDACYAAGEVDTDTVHAPIVKPVLNVLSDALDVYLGGPIERQEKIVMGMQIGGLSNALSSIMYGRMKQTRSNKAEIH